MWHQPESVTDNYYYMKKIIFTSFVLLFLNICFSQQNNDVYKNNELIRIPLIEKFNLPARQLPVLLMKAYCEGLIQGYYPLQVDSPCSYYNFVKQFGFGNVQPSSTKEQYSGLSCPISFCGEEISGPIENFMHYYEIIQQKSFDINKSSEINKIKYIRLIYTMEKGQYMIDLLGPVFRYEDVIQLTRNDFTLLNQKNNAANLSFKQYFEQRMFHGYLLKTSLLKGKDPDPKKNREKDVWEN